MCGIVGIISRYPVESRDWVIRGRDAMRHRGPDSVGIWWSSDYRVGLAHRRLAVIELSEAGHQPMVDDSGSLVIVFNGEIYNYRTLREVLIARGYIFRSNSDTEVILASYREWGADCVNRFNGMFAFAIYDARTQTAFLARDRAGEKPLFYRLDRGALRFSSELKGLLADDTLPRSIDRGALDCYLHMGFVPGDRCILQGYGKLPPAHSMSFSLITGEVQVSRYWQLPEAAQGNHQDAIDDTALLDELETLVADAVRNQLVADVPVGVLLSGGIDSSVVTALAARASRNLKTFTIRFPGHEQFDETRHARLIAQHFGTEHIELDADPSSVDMLPRLARQFDEPMVDSSMIPTFLVSQLVRPHCTVALGGDGGDELFGGYRYYSRLLWMKDRLGRIPYPVRAGIACAASSVLPVGFKGRNWLQGLGVDLDDEVPLIACYFDGPTRRKLMNRWPDWEVIAESFIKSSIPVNSDILQRATRMDFYNYLSEDILVKVDRASMLNSLEVRAPFLDYRLIEFAFSKLDSRKKATPTSRKLFLKRLADRLLPREFDRNRKQGFSIPLGDWLKSGKYREFFYDTILDSQCMFNPQVIRNMLRGQELGCDNGERLFGLVLFELWRKEYNITGIA